MKTIYNTHFFHKASQKVRSLDWHSYRYGIVDFLLYRKIQSSSCKHREHLFMVTLLLQKLCVKLFIITNPYSIYINQNQNEFA